MADVNDVFDEELIESKEVETECTNDSALDDNDLAEEQSEMNSEDNEQIEEITKETAKHKGCEEYADSNELAHLEALMDEQKVSSERIASEMREIHRLYHNEFAGRLRNMQEELDKYHEIDRGRVFDEIFREIARIYCDNEALLNIDTDDKVKKRIKYLFMDIEQLLQSYGVQIQRSSPGDKRNNKFCQIVDRIETDDPEKHDTVACSKGTGFFTEKKPLIKELIDVYIYQKSSNENSDSDIERS